MAFLVDEEVVAGLLDYGPCVHIPNTVLPPGVFSMMNMTAADDVDAFGFCKECGLFFDVIGDPEDLLAAHLDVPGDVPVIFSQKELDTVVETTPEVTPHLVLRHPLVELVAVHEEIGLLAHFEDQVFILSNEGEAQHVADDVEDAAVMITFAPDDFPLTLERGPLPALSEELPALFLEAIPVVVLNEVLVDDEGVELNSFQNIQESLEP